jgi:hypothetical protein
MVDLNDPASTRLLLKKLWCHGQLVAPLQATAYAWWAVVATKEEMLFEERILLWVSAAILPFWGYVSWRQMHSNSENAGKIILRFGFVVEVLHTTVVIFAARKLSNTANLVVFIFTLLHVIETFAYLLAVWCFKSALHNDRTRAVDQAGLLGVVQPRSNV